MNVDFIGRFCLPGQFHGMDSLKSVCVFNGLAYASDGIMGARMKVKDDLENVNAVFPHVDIDSIMSRLSDPKTSSELDHDMCEVAEREDILRAFDDRMEELKRRAQEDIDSLVRCECPDCGLEMWVDKYTGSVLGIDEYQDLCRDRDGLDPDMCRFPIELVFDSETRVIIDYRKLLTAAGSMGLGASWRIGSPFKSGSAKAIYGRSSDGGFEVVVMCMRGADDPYIVNLEVKHGEG